MKKLLSVVALVAFASVVLVGCKPAEEKPVVPTVPTNAPAAPAVPAAPAAPAK